MKSLVVFSLFLVAISGTAHANPKARLALGAVPQSQIDQKVKEALKEMSPNAPLEASQIVDYTSCLKDAAFVCSRYILFNVSAAGGSTTPSESLVLELNASLENGLVSIDTAYDYRSGELDLNASNLEIVLAALAKLETDYKGESPIRSKPADHPFQIKLLIISNASESNGTGEDEQWDSRDNYLVQFVESGYSRVVGWISSDTYLVRVKELNNIRVMLDVKKVLNLDDLLN
jgi:hypothetical protein